MYLIGDWSILLSKAELMRVSPLQCKYRDESMSVVVGKGEEEEEEEEEEGVISVVFICDT